MRSLSWEAQTKGRLKCTHAAELRLSVTTTLRTQEVNFYFRRQASTGTLGLWLENEQELVAVRVT